MEFGAARRVGLGSFSGYRVCAELYFLVFYGKCV